MGTFTFLLAGVQKCQCFRLTQESLTWSLGYRYSGWDSQTIESQVNTHRENQVEKVDSLSFFQIDLNKGDKGVVCLV